MLYALLGNPKTRRVVYGHLFKEQKGKCAICGTERAIDAPKWMKLLIDHDHETDEVRGLLCQSCNILVGRLEHRFVEKALDYLAKHSR